MPTLPEGLGLHLEVTEPGPVPWSLPAPSTVVVRTAAQLDAMLGAPLPDWVDLAIVLSQDTGPWLLAHRETLAGVRERVRLHQPTHERMKQALAADLRDPAGFFRQLGLRVRVSGLPACLAPGCELVEAPRVVASDLFDDGGRLDIDQLAHLHVAERYRAKSVRCGDCRVDARCAGLHINAIRDQGLGLLTPLVDGPWAADAEAQLAPRWPEPPPHVRSGRDLQPAHESLPGHAPPGEVPEDPLARKRGLKRSDFWEKTRIVQDATS